MNFVVAPDQRVKNKQKQKDRTLLAGEVTKKWNKKVTIIPIVVGVL